MNQKVVLSAVFSATMLMTVAGCKHKAAPAPPVPPPPAASNNTQPPPPAPPPPRPQSARINSFTVEPQNIQRGQPATLTWSVANATDISIEPGLGAVPANGTRQVFPGSTTTYTLTARSGGGSDMRSATVNVASPTAPPPPAPPEPTISGIERLQRDAQDAYFDYDKSDVRDDARQALTRDADLLKSIFAADPNLSVVIEGHCDERGSAEYNLGLGDRRATSAKDFLVGLGVPENRIRVISYGKERPVCTDATEECYQRNRRAHLAAAQ